MDGSASPSPRGVEVEVTERGLPVALRLDARQLAKSPTEFARGILLTCQWKARRVQVARRCDLLARGVDEAVITTLRLSTEDDLLLAGQQLIRPDDGTPQSWMMPI